MDAHQAEIDADPVNYAIQAYLDSPGVNRNKITIEDHAQVALIRARGG